MIGHQDIRVKLNGIPLQTLLEHAEESFVVLVFMKDSLPSITTIQGMVNQSCFVNSLLPGIEATPLQI